MTDLDDRESPDDEDFVVCWMQPQLRSATERDSDDEFPFCVVAHIDGADDPDCGDADGVVQLDFYDKARDGMTAVQAAKMTARAGHRRMRLLRESPDVVLSDGSTANVDYFTVVLQPFRNSYSNPDVIRYTARYALGFSDVTVS